MIEMWTVQEELDSVKERVYPDTDVFLICYSCDSKTSLNNIISTVIDETIKNHPNSVFVLAGTKVDLYDRKDKSHVSFSDGEKVKRKYGAKAHIRCSAKYPINTREVFQQCLAAGYEKKYGREDLCSVS